MSKSIIPTGSEVVREAIVLIAGGVLAAWLLYQLPQVRAYINGARSNSGQPGCNCN
jgi:hypothetical protein